MPGTETYVRWDAPGVEDPIPSNESEILDEISSQIQTCQHAVLAAQKEHHSSGVDGQAEISGAKESSTRDNDKLSAGACPVAFTGTHVKTFGVLTQGKFTIGADLPPHLAQGIAANAAGTSFPAAMRYSSEPTALVDDRVSQPRGAGLKLFNVPGKRLAAPPGVPADLTTMDLEFNSAPNLELGSPKITRDIIALRLKYGSDAQGLDKALRQRDDYDVQDGRNRAPNAPVVAQTMYSQAPIR